MLGRIMSLGGDAEMTTGEVYVRIRGSGVPAILDLIDRRLLLFEVTKHSTDKGMKQLVFEKLVAHPALRNALVYATARRCHIHFGRGAKVVIKPDERMIAIGIDADPDVAVRLIGGPEFEQTFISRKAFFLSRFITWLKNLRRAA